LGCCFALRNGGELTTIMVMYRYLRALAAFYVRLTFDPLNVYEVLEPLLDDYRKLRTRAMGASFCFPALPSRNLANTDRTTDGSYSLTTMDEFADQLLNDERVCEIQLPRLTQRKVLEETEGLAPRRSKLGKAMGVLDDGGMDEDEDDEERGERYLSRSPSGSRSPSPEGEEEKEPEYWTEGSEDEDEADVGKEKEKRGRKRSASVAGSEGRFISRSPSADGSEKRFVSRSPTRSPEPMQVDAERVEGDV
jgi:pre-mRNA-splicing factor 38A